MLPTLKEGDMVFFKKYIKNKSLLKVGQIVIIYHPLKNIRLIKRVKSIIKNSIEVLGDNIEYSDYSYKFGLINNEKVIGIVTSKIKKIF
jgi:nickel-type superoxide dismutase maturation protease